MDRASAANSPAAGVAVARRRAEADGPPAARGIATAAAVPAVLRLRLLLLCLLPGLHTCMNDMPLIHNMTACVRPGRKHQARQQEWRETEALNSKGLQPQAVA